ncbi:trigger factor [Acidomonas methanolica]|uniref:Trigger factor n=1 Tax=Acidomonas methanolica NBRC 104435 TaxID=1231351 RepID=A0A023D6H0_ACIMT|nr:trigger factor [Acidomonas methanolica]MBU2653157.1 trigger factor [Acidomonas methanolica]TCS32106.1 trigger factor [Acidomonas methanolica]GAJ29416.1 peptidyl-prolyl cis-trans isomerase trigger factor [Acidomonas methanolica NBRC 104435]GBQ56024.1 peptidyl-prolyl cis-trans isomerase trigger factor [Acidomonas methanolica]GEK97539.1 trigger factor [Acidomonas methanolica NBRC 104435]
MQVQQTHSEGLKRGFTVTVPAGDLEARRAARLAELGRTVNLPGFRPGKVPVSVVRQRYGAAVEGEVMEQTVNESTSRLLEEQKLRPATQPRVELVSGAEGKGDLEFKVDLEILPEITLPDLTGLKLTRLTAKPEEATIEKSLGELAKRQRTFEDVAEERPAATGDVLNVDFVGKLDGVPFDGGTAQDVNVEIGGDGFIPGFAEQLEGMKPGEEKIIAVTFPEDYGAKELAGKDVTFDIKANALKKAVEPALDDELAKTIGFEGIEQVRDLITKQVEGEYAQLSRLRIKRDLLDILADRTDFDAPPSMVEAEFGQIWARVEQDRANGEIDEEDAGKDEDTLKADYRKIAERRVKLGLLLAEIGRVKEIAVSREDMMQAMRQEALRYPGQERAVFEFFTKNPQAAETLRGPILENKVVDYLIELADVTEKDVTPEELAEIPPADL